MPTQRYRELVPWIRREFSALHSLPWFIRQWCSSTTV